MNPYQDLKLRAYRCNMDLQRHGVVVFTFGNASAIDRQAGVIAIKPSGVAYEELRAEDMVLLDRDGRVLQDSMQPSSDTKTHLLLYRHFPHIGGVVHTHSTYAVAWAQAARAIPILGTTHADYTHLDIPCTDFMSDQRIQGDYEEETGRLILQTFKDRSAQETEMVLVAGHGPFTWGATPEKAVHNCVILEELAKMALLTLQVNPETSRLKEMLIQKHYRRKHGPDAYYGQDKNKG